MDKELPASLSGAVHELIRSVMGFDGVVMTDDLAMDAVSAYAENGDVAVMALLARKRHSAYDRLPNSDSFCYKSRTKRQDKRGSDKCSGNASA